MEESSEQAVSDELTSAVRGEEGMKALEKNILGSLIENKTFWFLPCGLLVILLYKMQVIKEGINEYSTLKEADQNMTLYSKFIEQKPMIQ